jgi:hypothetical protein
MIDHHRFSIISTMILATSDRRGRFSMRPKDRFLFGMAPLPFFTGIIPYAIEGELTVQFMPEVNTAQRMSFGARNKEGFRLGLLGGIDIFFGMSSVVARMSEIFPTMIKGSGGGRSSKLKLLLSMRPRMAFRLLRALLRARRRAASCSPRICGIPRGSCAAVPILPALRKRSKATGVCARSRCLAAPSPPCIGTETWTKDGLVLFPDVCFYEFIPEQEMEKSLEDPSYQLAPF